MKQQYLNLNFCMKINEYVDVMKFMYMDCGLKRLYTIVAQNDKLPVGLIAQLVEHCTGISEFLKVFSLLLK